jgi:hypothetical protein
MSEAQAQAARVWADQHHIFVPEVLLHNAQWLATVPVIQPPTGTPGGSAQPTPVVQPSAYSPSPTMSSSPSSSSNSLLLIAGVGLVAAFLVFRGRRTA